MGHLLLLGDKLLLRGSKLFKLLLRGGKMLLLDSELLYATPQDGEISSHALKLLPIQEMLRTWWALEQSG